MKNYAERDEFLRKRAERKRKLRIRNLVIGYFAFMITALCVLTVLTFTVFFPIKSLGAKGSKVYGSEQILAASGIEKGDNLFTVNPSKVLKNLKKNLPFVESIKIERKLPDTLNIIVTDADEYACIFSKGKYYTISSTGWVLEKGDAVPENIFEIRGVEVNCKVASAVEYKNSEEKELLKRLLTAFEEKDITLNYIDITDKLDITIGAESRFNVKLGSANNTEEKIKHFEKMAESIPENESGLINLSMWTPENTTATYVKNEKTAD